MYDKHIIVEITMWKQIYDYNEFRYVLLKIQYYVSFRKLKNYDLNI